MSLLWFEGFGASDHLHYPPDTRFVQQDTGVLADVGPNGAGDYALRINARGSNMNLDYGRIDLNTESDLWIVGFDYNPSNRQSSNNEAYPVFAFLDGPDAANQQQCVISRTEEDALQVRSYDGGSVLAQSDDNVITLAQWQYIEIKIYCHATNGYVIIRVDGTEVINVTSINTQYQGSGALNSFHFRSWVTTSGYYSYIDNMIIMDNSGTYLNDFQGSLFCIDHFPYDDGTYSDCTPDTAIDNYDAVNDTYNAWDDHYVDGDTVGEKDSYLFTPSGSYPSIKALEVKIQGINPGSGVAKVKPFVIIDSTFYYGDEDVLDIGDYETVSHIWETNPATGTLWSKSAVAAAEFGFEVTEIT